MTLPWLGEEDAVLWHGDVRALLAEVPDESVQCVVTSPPYFGLRDYGVDGQIGLETSPGEFIDAMVDVFREVRRVLREDGVCWLNLGDSYANDGKWGGHAGGKHVAALHCSPIGRNKRYTGFKAKDLIGIPWAVAFALREDGWYLRADAIWSKPNPMPESVTDRPTKAHEYIFLLTKSERYYWDVEGAKEAVSGTAHARGSGLGRKGRATAPGLGIKQNSSFSAAVAGLVSRRNIRSVWTITTQPYPGAHFATFPPEIPRRCIRASTPEGGCCAACRRPYRRVVEKGAPLAAQQAACGANANGGYTGTARKDYGAGKAQDPSATKARILAGMVERRTVGWVPQCACGGYVVRSITGRRLQHADAARRLWYRTDWQDRIDLRWGRAVPSLVLDPFAGSGTTLAVAIGEGRRALGFELNPEYIGLALDRIDQARGRRVQVA